MAFNAYELTTNGELNIAGNLNTRLPVITNGLVAHFPFDGRGGAFDGVGGNQTLQNVETGVNLIEAMQSDWRDPSSWSSNSGMSWDEGKQALKIDGYHNSWLNTPIVVDVNKHYQVSIEVMEEVQSSTGLYLGGLCNNSSGQRVTPNYDYSYGANAQPATGVWTKYCTTRYGTGNQVDRTSTTFANVSGWMGTNTGVTDKLTKYYYYGGLFNYSGGGVMYIRNLNITIIDADTSNTTITNDGIAVEEAIINLWTGGYTPYNNYGVPASITQLNEYYLGQPVYRLAMTVDDVHASALDNFQTALNSHGVYGGSLSWTENTQFVSSIYWRPVNKLDTVFGGTASNTTGWSAGPTEYLENGWRRFYRYRTGVGVVTKSDAVHHSFYCPSLKLNETIYIDFCCAQTEQGRIYPTSYNSGSRGAPYLYTDNLGGHLEYSIYGEFMPTLPFSNAPVRYAEGQVDSSLLWAIYDTVNPGYIGFRYWESGTNSCPYLSRSGSYLTGNMHSYYELTANQWASFVATKKGTVFTLKIYQNGYKGQHIATVDANARLDNFRIGVAPVFGALYKNISIYNRELSSTEIMQLISPTFELKPNGDLIIPNVISKLIIPDDVYYFPLGADAKDEYKVISPTTETNTVYENGAVWIGTASINLIDPSAYSLNSNNGGVYPIQNELYEGHRRVRRNPDFVTYPSTAFSCYTGTFFDAIIGKYSFSLKVRPEKDVRLTLGSSTTLCLANQWTTLTCTVDIAIAASTRGHGLTSPDPFNSNFNPWIEYKEYQIEQKAFSTPFVNGTRGNSNIIYSPDLINFNQGTMGGWFYPTDGFFTTEAWNRLFGHSTSTNANEIQVKRNDTGNNLVMSISNNAGSPQSSWSSCPSANIEANKWYFVVARWNITTGKMSLTVNGVKNEQAWISTYQPTVKGSFSIGYHNTGGIRWSNSYFKDVFVSQRELTDEEINDIYSKNLMQYLNNSILQIKDSIKTKQVII